MSCFHVMFSCFVGFAKWDDGRGKGRSWVHSAVAADKRSYILV